MNHGWRRLDKRFKFFTNKLGKWAKHNGMAWNNRTEAHRFLVDLRNTVELRVGKLPRCIREFRLNELIDLKYGSIEDTDVYFGCYFLDCSLFILKYASSGQRIELLVIINII